MQPWFIPMFYVSGAALGGLALPRIEQAYLSSYTLGVSVASAQALLSAAASGMMALTGIVFAMAFVMVQFSAIAYSPRLVLWFARDRMLSTHWARSLQLSSMRCSRSPGWTAAARQRSRYFRCCSSGS